MNDKEKLTQLIQTLAEKEALTKEEAGKYAALIASGDAEEVKQALIRDIEGKLAHTDNAIIDTGLAYAAAVRNAAMKTGDEELLEISDDLDEDIKSELETLDEEVDALRSDWNELAPMFKEAEETASV